MPIDRSIFERNRAATQRIREFAKLNDDVLRTPVGQHWNAAVLLAHLSFWDLRVMFVLDKTQLEGRLFAHQSDENVNDYILPLLAALPPREAARAAVQAAEALDRRLEEYPIHLLEEVGLYNRRWVDRSLHRNEHLDDAAAVIKLGQ